MENFIKFMVILITILSTYIILVVGVKIIAPTFESNNSENLNQVYLNLAYGYVSGLIFYFFITLFPHLILKNKFKPAIDLKLDDLKIQITSYVRSFNSVENIDLNLIDLKAIQELLNKHSLLDRSHYSAMVGVTISNVSFLDSTKINIFNLIGNILTYREFLTSNQVLELEKIRDSKFFHLIKMADSPIGNNVYGTSEFKQVFAIHFYEIIESVRKI